MERTLTNSAATAIDMEATIEKIFKVFDTDGDGTLDKDEVQAFAKAFTNPPKGHVSRKTKASLAHADNLDKIMKSMDFENGDGKIQLPEFTAYLEAVLNAKFAQYDVDHSQTLTLDEMTQVVNDLCHSKTDDHQRKKDKHYVQHKKEWFMKHFDKDNGESVSAFEFQAYFLRQIDAHLKNWKPGKELPYCLRAAVNVNPGQIHKKVKEIESIEAKRVEKNQAIGVYEEDVFHVPDVTSQEDMKQVEAPELSQEEKINRDELIKKEAAKAEAKKHAVENSINAIRQSKGKEARDFDAQPLPQPLAKTKVPVKDEECSVCRACSIM